MLSAQLTHVIIITAVIEGNHEVKCENSKFGNIRTIRNTHFLLEADLAPGS
jgi:hypothetical protein